MNSESRENSKNLVMFRHRLRMLLLCEGGLIILQLAGMMICAAFVVSNFFGWQLGTLTIATKHFTFLFNDRYLNILCFIISILLIFSRPVNLREQINVLKMAIEYLSRNNGVVVNDYEKDIIEKAKGYVTEAEIVMQKKLEGREDEIEPHERRMVLRKRMIIFGIPGISILTVILLFGCGWNIPQMASVNLLIGYALVMLEAYYYQLQLKKANISVMSERHKKIIKKSGTEQNEIKKDAEEGYKKQIFKFYQKIFYMRADRFSNYCLVLGVASSATNMLAILITILENTKNADFQKLFALEISYVNSLVAMIFMAVSIILYFADIFSKSRFERVILEARAFEKLNYSEENYRSLKEKIDSKMCGKSIFSRDMLDIGRGTYDFNNDMLVGYYLRREQSFIPVECMLTVRASFPGRIPRYKLTALIVWLCGFCGIVWGTAKLKYIFPLSILAITIYIFLVLLNAVHLWNYRQEWISFEKENRRMQESKWDFLGFATVSSSVIIILLILNDIWTTKFFIVNRSLLFGGISIICTTFVGFLLARKKVKMKKGKMNEEYRALLYFVAGAACIAVQYVAERKVTVLFVAMVLIFSAISETAASYLQRIKRKNKREYEELPACTVVLLGNCSTILVLLWRNKMMFQNRISFLLMWLYCMATLLLFCRMLWKIVQNWESED